MTNLGNFARKKINSKMATHNGPLVTKTTLIKTDVYSRDVTQLMKCNAKNIPALNAKNKSFRFSVAKFARCFSRTNGVSKIAAIIKREDAMNREGIPSVCANFTRIAEKANEVSPR